MSLLGQLRAIWDNAGQLVELRGEIERIDSGLTQLHEQLQKLDERTRKQNYRERKELEDASWRESNGAAPVGARSAVLAAARARGLVR